MTAGLLALNPTLSAFPVSQWLEMDIASFNTVAGTALVGFPFHLVRGTVGLILHCSWWKATGKNAPAPRELKLPRIEQVYSGCCEVLGVARDERQAMNEGGRGNQRVPVGFWIWNMKFGAFARDL